MPSTGDAKEVAVNLPAAWLEELKTSKVKDVVVATSGASVRVSADLISGQNVASNSQLQIVIAGVNDDSLPAAVQARLDGQAAYDFHMQLDGQKVEWKGNKVEVTMPYTLKPGQKTNGIVVYHVTGDGQLEAVNHVRYNAAAGTISFKAKHFSIYTAVHVNASFTDIGGYPWAVDPIEGLAAKGIVKGMSESEFAPQGSVTRAQFIQMLMHALGLIQKDAASSFTDVEAGGWYYEAVASAQALGIIQGKPDGSFGINEQITRQDMAVMLHKAILLTGLPLEGSEAAAASFKDAGQISTYAADAVSAIQRAGIISGIGSGMFAPKAAANRAQAAVIIANALDALYIQQ